LIITSANVDRFSQFFNYQIPEETVYVTMAVNATKRVTNYPLNGHGYGQ